MPKLTIPPLTHEPAAAHPVLGAVLDPYAHAVLGNPGGLTQFGVHLEVLPPGSRSSIRHWHETEDEMIYVLAGALTLIEDCETLLAPGDCVCWPKGSPTGHCLENRSGADATYLTVGTRNHSDRIHYPDHDLITVKEGIRRTYLYADGRPRSLEPPS
jgi:uncharacterized cupin superfamily protein